MSKSDMRLFIELLKERCKQRNGEIYTLKHRIERLQEAQSCSLIKESGAQLNNMLLHNENDKLRIENDRLKAQMSEIGKALIARNDRLNRAFWEVAVAFYSIYDDHHEQADRMLRHVKQSLEDTRNAKKQ